MKKIKIFLASSIEDLKIDRLEVGDFFGLLNDIYISHDIFFSLVKCEDYDNAIAANGKQSQYDAEIRDSELIFFLFFKTVGDYTKHEFDVALESFLSHGKPKISVYFKSPTDEATAEVKEYMNTLTMEKNFHYNIYENIDTLKLGIIMQIKCMYPECSDIDICGGKVYLNGRVVANKC